MMCFRTYHQALLSIGFLLCGAFFMAEGASAQNGAAAAVTSKFLSWNVAGGPCNDKRSESEFTSVVTELQHLQDVHNFDVLSLQEVHYDQALRLARALNRYGIRTTPFFIHTARCENGSRRGNAILSKYRLGGRRVHQLPDSTRDTDNGEHRKLMGASIRVGGRLIRVYNTHLTADGCSHLRNPMREKQVRFIRSYMHDDRIDASGPWRAVLTGDFNTRPNTYAYRRILTHRMKNAWSVHTGGGDEEEGCTHYLRENGGCTRETCTRIDYIFYEGAIGVVSAGVLDTRQLSDHRPIVAHLTLD